MAAEHWLAAEPEKRKANPMKNLVIASIALFGLAGAAAAQEAPGFYGYNPYNATIESGQIATRSITASDRVSTVSDEAPGSTLFSINQNQNYSGK
ncbi:MAG: hypothetical protein LCH93_22500 [Proteobacteria bacterium]|nr:hypothetical protein [Pseudomonadota bacterium]